MNALRLEMMTQTRARTTSLTKKNELHTHTQREKEIRCKLPTLTTLFAVINTIIGFLARSTLVKMAHFNSASFLSALNQRFPFSSSFKNVFALKHNYSSPFFFVVVGRNSFNVLGCYTHTYM